MLVAGLERGLGEPDAGVVHQNVGSSHRRGRGTNGVGVGHVAVQKSAIDVGGHGSAPVVVDIERDHLAPVCGQTAGDGLAESLPRARHHGQASSVRHVSPSFVREAPVCTPQSGVRYARWSGSDGRGSMGGHGEAGKRGGTQ